MAKLVELYKRLPYPFQTLMLNGFAAKIHWQRYGKPFHELMEFFTKSERFSSAELAAYQDERVHALARHAYENVPYYREVFSERKLTPGDIRTVADLQKLPILTREIIRTRKADLINKSASKGDLFPGQTSGTTGSPLQFYWDLNTCRYTNALDWRQKAWGGIQYGDPMALFLGRAIVPPDRTTAPFWQKNYLHNHLWMSSFHLSEENFDAYRAKLESYRPKALEGYPSTMSILARLFDSRGMVFPVKAVFTSSETLLPVQRELIERVFQCKVFDFLGMAERVIFATQCNEHNGYHLNTEFAVTEIVDSEGEALPRSRPGYICGTSLTNYAMPFLRYRTSDVSMLEQAPCPCGRTLPLLHGVTTKDEDIVTTPEGKFISSSILTHPFKPLRTIRESQVIQESLDLLVIKLVCLPEYSEADSEQLIASLRERVGPTMRIQVEKVFEIPRGPNGKFRWVISRVPLRFAAQNVLQVDE